MCAPGIPVILITQRCSLCMSFSVASQDQACVTHTQPHRQEADLQPRNAAQVARIHRGKMGEYYYQIPTTEDCPLLIEPVVQRMTIWLCLPCLW